MNWTLFHAWVEEFELWSTTIINAAIILGAIPAAIAYFRRIPPRRILAFASYGAAAGGLATSIFAIVFVLTVPTSMKDFSPYTSYGDVKASFAERYIAENLPRMPKEVRDKYAAEKKRGMPDVLAWCRATSFGDDDVEECIVLMSR